MATVYLARALGLVDFRRFFAIKRLHPHLNKDPDFVAMFVDEARLAARIHHPNVVPIFEIGVKDEQYFLVMDYIEGDTASRLMIRSKHLGRALPIGFTVRVLVETLAGLHAAHELASDDGRPLEIVHRDVSPQNILLGVDGVARITDFGVARAAARIGDQTQGGQLKGKLAYMAPEQIRGGKVDRRVDVFAAGIVLWEMLAGERLFKAETDGETLFKVAAAEVPDLRAKVPGLAPEIAALCHRALAKEPQDRFATAADFGDALEAAARAAGQMFTARESAALVNELVGQEITAHRDLVRTWLTRSDVSRSGVALAQAFPPPVRADVEPSSASGSRDVPAPPPAQAPSPSLADTAENEVPRLSNLASDHEELATRLDLDVEVAAPVDANGMPLTPPAPPPTGPLGMPVIPQPPTMPDFRPMGLPPEAVPPASGSAPMPAQAPGQPMAAPPPMAMAPAAPAPAPAGGSRVPAWTLAIPVILVLGVCGAVLALKAKGGDATPPPAKTTATATATAADTATTAATTTATTTVAATATATATTTAIATATTTAKTTAEPTATTKATAPATATAQGTAPRPTATGLATVKPTATTTTKPKIDNSSFGGRK